MHIEIPADDTSRSQEFWGSLFEWQFQANPGLFGSSGECTAKFNCSEL